MRALLRLSALVDLLSEKVSQTVRWLMLAAVLICSVNALVRYAFNTSSNAWLELQWYLFAAVFLLGASYTLKRDEHVRIDIVTGRFGQRAQAWIDVFGFVFFLLPVTLAIVWVSVPYAFLSWEGSEMSSNAGGLIRWPAKILLPLGFGLLTLQGISELIKRVAYLRGQLDASAFRRQSISPEDEIKAIAEANKLDVQR